jgi:hypothetical protein
VKLALFQATTGEVLPGVLTERGIVAIADAVPRGHTPQATMQGIIDGFAPSRFRGRRLRDPRDRSHAARCPRSAEALVGEGHLHGRRLDQSRGSPTQLAAERRLIGLAR